MGHVIIGFKKPAYDTLICPFCGQDNLHQRKIEIFNRAEDEDTGFHITVENDSATLDSNMDKNPSDRRQGLSITFDCEQCPNKPVLTIYQHKGVTIMEWVNDPLAEQI